MDVRSDSPHPRPLSHCVGEGRYRALSQCVGEGRYRALPRCARESRIGCNPLPLAGEGRVRVRSRGLTLIELMVVMGLSALLLTIGVPRYFGTINTAKQSVQRQKLFTIRDA